MPASSTQIIRDNLRALDYLEGEGIFPHAKRDVVPKKSFLIISYGGTGGEVLYALKKRLQRDLDDDDFEQRVRILAIDTDTGARKYTEKTEDPETHQEQTRVIDKFTPAEFQWLDGSPARALINNRILDGVDNWINPRLLDKVKSNQDFLNGEGAGATRQVGRLLLTPKATRDNLRNKIVTLVGELTNNNTNKLMVFILTGISGGTGSGIVIDGTYLIRSYINSAVAPTRVEYWGFVLLPPTGDSARENDILSGDLNGYSALKEIDYFMTLPDIGKSYQQQFGQDLIKDSNKLFDACYLIDGSIPGMNFSNARQRAKEVVTDCVLDMITSQQTVGGNGPQPVESFMSNASKKAEVMVGKTDPKIAPREANYIYCVLGHGQTLIPLDLMKGYVAKAVFDKMYALFKNCEHVSDKDVEIFLEKVQCPTESFFGSPIAPKALRNNIDAETDRIFSIIEGSKGGPFYVINLLKDALEEVNGRLSDVRRGHAINRVAKEQSLTAARDRIAYLNNSIFQVYTTVLKEMQRYLNQAYDIATEQQDYTNSYYFRPIDFGSTDEKSRIVRDFLDKLVESASTKRFCKELVEQMVKKREEWTNLYEEDSTRGHFDAAREIQIFWSNGVSKILDATLEDYLLKYYTGVPEAKWETLPDGVTPTQTADQGMRKAAEAIVDQMFDQGMATPLASINTSILMPEEFDMHRYLLIPKSAPHLKNYVQQVIADRAGTGSINPQTIQVYNSGANDRVSCYTQYTGVPAYILEWTLQGEKAYERQLTSAGLHMSETKGGSNWRGFPNLIPRELWSRLDPDYSNQRESKILDLTALLFDRALEMKLALKSALAGAPQYNEYKIRVLQEKDLPDEALFKALDAENEGTEAQKRAKAELDSAVAEKATGLFQKADWEQMPEVELADLSAVLEQNGLAAFSDVKLGRTTTVMTAVGNKPEGWDEDLAKKLLRLDLDLTDRLRGTEMVLDALYSMIDAAQAKKHQIRDFAKYLVAGLFHKAEGDTMWTYFDENGYEQDLFEMPYGVKEAETAEEYLLFKAYAEKAGELRAGFEQNFAERLAPTDDEIAAAGGKDRVARNKKKQELIDKAKALGEKMNKKKDPKSADTIVTKAYEAAAGEAGLPVGEIREFYNQLIPVLTNSFASLLAKYGS